MHDLPDPLAEADQEWPIEAEALANAFHVSRRCLIAGDHCRGVARCDVEEAEDEQRDHRHHRDGRHDAPDDVAQHALTLCSRPRRRAAVPSRCRWRLTATLDGPGRNPSGHITSSHAARLSLAIATFSSAKLLASYQA